jgi:hypothetical protein
MKKAERSSTLVTRSKHQERGSVLSGRLIGISGFLPSTYQLGHMYDKNSKKDWVSAGATATVGASLAATFSVLQGRDPLVALVILVFAVAVALVIDHFW